MNKYKVEIFTPGKMIEIKGKLIRSPVEFVVDEVKLVRVKMEIELQGILDYKISPYSKELESLLARNKDEIEESIGEEIKVEDSNKPETTLESLLKDT